MDTAMPDLDTLQKNWPLIAQHPWEFLWAFVAGVTIGVLLNKGWASLTSAKPKPVEAPPVPKPKRPVPAPPPFEPSSLQSDCIQALRYYDDEWVTPDMIVARLPPGTPRADVRHAMEELVEMGWAGDRHAYGGTDYRLKGPGLLFAQAQSFPVGPPSGY